MVCHPNAHSGLQSPRRCFLEMVHKHSNLTISTQSEDIEEGPSLTMTALSQGILDFAANLNVSLSGVVVAEPSNRIVWICYFDFLFVWDYTHVFSKLIPDFTQLSLLGRLGEPKGVPGIELELSTYMALLTVLPIQASVLPVWEACFRILR